MTDVLDASALLAYLQGERGADIVERVLSEGAACGAANWSEVSQKIRARGRDWALSRSLLLSWGLHVRDVSQEDAERAAGLWRAGDGLSLADRLCLALGERAGATVWTADTAWGDGDSVKQIR
ncbi:MAG: type II toxin-antitoxin system VapC family toxin [Kineosporiaceae bacterium]